MNLRLLWKNKAINITYILLIIFNLIDCLLTLYFVKNGIIEEVNILIKYLLDNSIILYLLIKGLVVSFFISFLYLFHKKEMARVSLLILFFIYFLIMLIWTSVVIVYIYRG